MISLKELKVKYDPKDGYAPKSADEKRFRDKHKVQAHADRNGNGDDVFKGSKVSTVDREKENHGYDATKDQEVYEDVEQATDSIPFGKPYKVKPATVTDKSGAQHNPMSRVKNLARQTLVKMNPKKGGEPITKITPAQGDKVQEEVELDEMDKSQTPPGRGGENEHNPNGKTYYVKHVSKKKAEKDALKILNKSFNKEEVEEVDEVLKPSMGAAAYIKDFVHSDDPKFKGKSKKQRMKQALAAFYSAKRGD